MTKARITPQLFEKKCWQRILQDYAKDPFLLVIPKSSTSGISHKRYNMFPSFPVILPLDYFKFCKRTTRYKDKKISYGQTPDIGIIWKNDITEFWINNKKVGVYDILGKELNKIFYERKAWWIISEELVPRVLNYIQNPNRRTNKHIIVLRKNAGLSAIIDVKYENIISASDIEKLIIDASISAAKECLIMTTSSAKLRHSGNEFDLVKEFELEIKDELVATRLYRLNTYKPPDFITLDRFLNVYQEHLKEFK